MLVHLRLNVPTSLSDDVRAMFVDDDRVTNLSIQTGASIKPKGDLIEVDVAREAVSPVLDGLKDLGLDTEGGISLSRPMDTPSTSAGEAERAAHGDPDDAVIWLVLQRAADAASRPTFNFVAFLVIATALAAIAVITDSAILVVGAMVVGPEFSAVAAVCTGIVLRQWQISIRSLGLLAWTFLFAIAFITVLAWVGRHVGFVTAAQITAQKTQTSFIWHPDRWSFVVALWAGAAGVLALALDKANAMVGVFISVTTVPAAGNLALALSLGDGAEAFGSLRQLGLNVAGMIVAGVVTLLTQRLVWRRIDPKYRLQISRRHAQLR